MISLIVAHDEALTIGKDNWMPWDLKQDLANFKAITLHKKIAMGKTTFLGLPKPLKDRYTYVVSTTMKEGIDPLYGEIVADFEALLTSYQHTKEELIVCGGASLYKQCLPYVDVMYISVVEGVHPGDTYFPVYDVTLFEVVETKQFEGFTFYKYQRK
ncbi:MAG: dihydrofolate reductase [Erysipelotrichaceae bacterium]